METEDGERRTENGNREQKQRTESREQFPVFRFLFQFLFTVYSSLCSVFFLSCSPAQPPSPLLATVNGDGVTLAEFQNYVQTEQWKFGEVQSAKAKEKLLDGFLKDHLLLTEAKRRGINVSSQEINESVQKFKSHYPKEEEFEKLLSLKGSSFEEFEERRAKELTIQKLVEAVVDKELKLSGEDLKKYYQEHRGEFQHGEEVHARQLVTDSKEKAQALREMLLKGTPFEEVALKYSLSPDRKEGGDLGWFERGRMPKEFDAICFSLPVMELSPVVQTPYGYHLFQILEKRGAGELSFEEVQTKIRERLKSQRGREVFQKFYERLRASAKVKVYEEVLQQIQ